MIQQITESRYWGVEKEGVKMENRGQMGKCLWKAACWLLEFREWSPVYIVKKLPFRRSFWKQNFIRLFHGVCLLPPTEKQ